MKAYSLDLRDRIAAACAQPGLTVGAVAARFSVSASFVAKLLRRQRQSGSLAALGGPNVSPATMGRAVQALDWRRKKRASTPPSATPPA